MRNLLTNPSRLAIRASIGALLTTAVTTLMNVELNKLLRDFNDSARGKNKSKGFIKSVALSSHSSRSKYTPHQSKQECARRLAAVSA